MKTRKKDFSNPAVFFAAGFFAGLFIKFLPFFIAAMLLLLAAGGICRCLDR